MSAASRDPGGTASRAASGAADLVRIFRALGDPSRLAIYEAVRASGSGQQADLRRNVTDIARQFDLSLSTVSHHLRELRNAGLIRCERRGQHIFCTAEPAALGAVERFLVPLDEGADEA